MTDLLEARRQSHEFRRSTQYDVSINEQGTDLFMSPDDMMVMPQQQDMTFSEGLSALGDSLVDTGAATGRAVLGGVRDAGQGFLDLTGELAELLESQVPLGYITYGPEGLGWQQEKPEGYTGPQLPEVPRGDSVVENIGRGLVQFAAGFTAAPVRGAGMVANMARGGFADALFNPEDGNLSTFLKDFGLDNDVINYLDSQVGEEAGAEERLRARMKNTLEGMGLGALIDTTMAGFKAARSDEGIKGTIRNGLINAGDRAQARLDEAGSGTTLTSGVDPMAAIDTALSFAGRLARGEEPVRAEGGLSPNSEKAGNELRLHSNRLTAAQNDGKAYPGAPKNPRTVIKAPSNSNLPDVVIGQVTPEDWRLRIEKAMSPAEINEAATWYKKVFGEFRKQAGGDPEEMAKLTDAWFAGQQNSSPSQTLNDVLFVYEQVKRGVPKQDLVGKGLPSANKIVFDILTGSDVSGGAGQKISDFLDSGYGKNVRSFMNNDPMGGSPFVVDVHTARDTGLVDEIYLNHLRRLGYDVPDNIVADFGGGGIKGAMYENRALYGAELTEHLNTMGWMGRSDWEPAEIQAIGWMQLSGMYGQSNTGGDVVDAFATNTRRISMEVDPGEGSPWADKFGQDYAGLTDADKISINNSVTAKAIDIVNKQQGIDLGQVVHGTGGWEMFQNASTVQQAIASKQSAVEAGARLGLLLNQTEVWVNSPKAMTKNPKHFAVDIIEDGAETLRDSDKLRELFSAIVEADPNGLFRGYQPVIIDGKPGIRILIDDVAIKNSPLSKAKAQEYIMAFANKELGEITDNLDINASVDIMEADLTKLRNDWTKDKDGGGYKSYISGQPGKDEVAGGSVLDTDRSELENVFAQLINDAKTKSTNAAEARGQEAVNVSASDGGD